MLILHICTLNTDDSSSAHSEYVASIEAGEIELEEDEDEDESTWGTRFTAKVVKSVVRGFEVKEKNVRVRTLQIFESFIPYLGPIE